MCFGGVLAERSLHSHVFFRCVDPALSLISHRWITSSYRVSPLRLKPTHEQPYMNIPSYCCVETVRGKVPAGKLRGRDERKLFIVIFFTLVAGHLSFMPHVMLQTKKLN